MAYDPIQRVGVDLIEIARVQAVLERHGERFLQRVFTPGEIADSARVSSLAARWAAKEAISKALGCGWDGIQWTELEVVRHPSGRTEVMLHGAARVLAESLGLSRWALSLSHSATHAIAFVVASGTGAKVIDE